MLYIFPLKNHLLSPYHPLDLLFQFKVFKCQGILFKTDVLYTSNINYNLILGNYKKENKLVLSPDIIGYFILLK